MSEKDIWTEGWSMFSTSKQEINDMLTPCFSHIAIEPDELIISDYLFEPSIAFRKPNIQVSQITDIDLNAYPPTVRVGDEVIFLSSQHKDNLRLFAYANQIPITERPDIWSWILEPFLDTEFTNDTNERVNHLLRRYGLDENAVTELRNEIKIQMLKYNFDTMLWEWVNLGANDALSAMRTKYESNVYSDFYWRVMKIALLTEIK
jgi:hypothetical protein